MISLLGNLPPAGHGVYARGQGIDYLKRFDFVAVNIDRGDARATARALKALGKGVWFYRTPGGWTPDRDDAVTIALHEDAVADTGADGSIGDAENGWPGADSIRALALSDALRASIERGFRWGFTSYPEFRHREIFARSGAWGSPQVYRPSDLRLWDKWSASFGMRMSIPSVSLWPSPQDYHFDQENYRPYLDAMPLARGSIGWTTGEGNGWMVSEYLSWSPSRDPVTRALLFLQAYAPTPVGIAIIAALVVLFFLWMRMRR